MRNVDPSLKVKCLAPLRLRQLDAIRRIFQRRINKYQRVRSRLRRDGTIVRQSSSCSRSSRRREERVPNETFTKARKEGGEESRTTSN